MIRRLPLALLLLAVAAGSAAAQTDPLDRVETLIAQARYDEARERLAELLGAESELVGAARARALLLRASLSHDAAAAEDDYLALVLGYPVSPDASLALLRLGQSALSSGDANRAVGYLQRLVRDYPGSPLRGEALLWLARAHDRAGNFQARCAAIDAGLQAARGDIIVAPLLRAADADPPCAALPPDSPAAEPDAGAIVPMIEPVSTAPDTDTTPTEPPQPEFAVQAGAFAERAPAEVLAGRLRLAGFDPRIVTVPANSLIRVRVGRHESAEAANETAAALRAAGFEAVVVADAASENTR
ncbi:MAG TPA: SPOR domain-containing protein [Longimicrobiales bacterium]|nr:SPOR domain-containing protein [Longimicrobiales bacterium]